jgi:hypothetical protein
MSPSHVKDDRAVVQGEGALRLRGRVMMALYDLGDESYNTTFGTIALPVLFQIFSA